MEHNFEYRQALRKERVRARQRANRARRLRLICSVFAFLFLFISIISVNVIRANADQEGKKAYVKEYIIVDVTYGDTVWSLAEEYMSPGFDSINDLVVEICFSNELYGDCTIKENSILLIPYFTEI